MRPIDADALLNTHRMEQSTIGKDWGVDDLAAAIEVAPTIEAVPVVHGRWIYHQEAAWKYECSECGCYYPGEWRYCANCGAKMIGGENDD